MSSTSTVPRHPTEAQLNTDIPSVSPSPRDYHSEDDDFPSNGGSLQDTIWKLCQQDLGSDLGLDEHFFEAGGDSLAIISLAAKMSQELGMELKPSLFIEHHTVEKLAKHLEVIISENTDGNNNGNNSSQQQKATTTATTTTAVRRSSESKSNHLILIQAGKPDRMPIVFVHAIAGHIFEYVTLAEQLGSEQPVYALQASNPSFNTIEQMAQVYLGEVVAKLCDRSFVLGGHSFGGMVALEMALQYERSNGRSLPLLVLLDSPLLESVPTSLKRTDIVKYMSKYHPGYVLSEAQINMWLVHQEGMLHYQPSRTFDGRTLFLKARTKIEELPISPEIPWHRVTRQLDVHTIEGDHATMLQGRNASHVASLVQNAIVDFNITT